MFKADKPITLDFRWPGGARVALWVVPNVEHYQYIGIKEPQRDPWPRSAHPDMLNYSHRDHGNRAGIWRMMDALDAHQIKCSTSLNLSVYDHYPEIREACLARNWETICHGIYNTQSVVNKSREWLNAYIQECQDMSVRLTGQRFNAWFSPGLSYSWDGIDAMAANGIEYICDLPMDDLPVRVHGKEHSLFAMPYQLDVNDGIFFNRRYKHGTGEDFARMIIDQFDTLYEQDQGPKVMCLALHPYIIGQPHNIRHLSHALQHMLARQDVWNATGGEILAHWRQHSGI